MKHILSAVLLVSFFFTNVSAQTKTIAVGNFIDTSNTRITEAIDFLQSYYRLFLENKSINYSHFFTSEQCHKFKIPDPIVYAFTTDVCTYTLFSKATIFYGKEYLDYIHLKTIFLWDTDSSRINPFAITNHYVYKNEAGFYFLTEMEHNKKDYTTVTNSTIEYLFPKTVSFNKNRSDSLIASLRKFEKEWDFKPIEKIQYVYTDSKEELAKMKGFDYLLLSDENTSSGYADVESNTVYCQGKGENYLHEILHLYLNPRYEKSPINHGLIYYLGGGVAGNYEQMIHQLKSYLATYPDTDLSEYDKLISKNRMVHINHTINAMLCKHAHKKEGVRGVKRLLNYTSLDDLYKKEYNTNPAEKDSLIRKMLATE